MHRAGVSSDQLESTVSAASARLNLQVEIFALPTNVTIAVGPRHAQQIVMLRMKPGRVNLRKLALLNDIFDGLSRSAIGVTQAIDALRDLDERAPPPNALLALAAPMLIAVGVAVILGGGANELLVAGLIGLSTGILSIFVPYVAAIDRLFEVIAAFAATLVVAAYAHFVGPVNVYIAIVSGVVMLLPGYSLTLALHELANQDLIAGTARLGRVLAILLALGCGALLGFALVGTRALEAAPTLIHPVGWLALLPAAILVSLGLSIDLDARLRDFAWVFLASIVALYTTHVFGALPVHQVSAFIAAFVCGLVANLGATYLRVPQPVFLIPALHVIVPGSLSYRSVLLVFTNRYGDAAALAINAAIVGILIVAGLLLSQLIVPASTLRAGARR